jgi:hypothetical protein
MSIIDTACSFTMVKMEKVGFKSPLGLDKTRRHCLSGFKFRIWSLLRVIRCDIVLRPARIPQFKEVTGFTIETTDQWVPLAQSWLQVKLGKIV